MTTMIVECCRCTSISEGEIGTIPTAPPGGKPSDQKGRRSAAGGGATVPAFGQPGPAGQ